MYWFANSNCFATFINQNVEGIITMVPKLFFPVIFHCEHILIIVIILRTILYFFMSLKHQFQRENNTIYGVWNIYDRE